MGNKNIKKGKYFNKKLKTILTQIPYSKLNLSQNLNAIQYNPIQIPKPKSYLNPNLKNQKTETNQWRIRDLMVAEAWLSSQIFSLHSLCLTESLSLSFSFSQSLCLIIQRYMSPSLNHFLVFLFFLIRVSIKGKIDLTVPILLRLWVASRAWPFHLQTQK